jgi:hypothetical protein
MSKVAVKVFLVPGKKKLDHPGLVEGRFNCVQVGRNLTEFVRNTRLYPCPDLPQVGKFAALNHESLQLTGINR